MFLFFPNNRTEVDDGFWYAQGIRDGTYLDLFNPRFFLFLPIMKLLYDLLQSLSINVDAYLFMCSMSMIFSGLTIILLYDTLAAHIDVGKKTSLFASLGVLISYEYWRYSYEAEVYIISLFLILLAFRWFMITKKRQDYSHAILMALLCGFTTLLYKPNFIPLFVAFPMIYLYFGKIRQLMLFYALGAIIIVGSFSWVYHLSAMDITFAEYLFGGTNTPTGEPYMALFVIASNIISVLWFFSSSWAVDFIRLNFPHKVIEEEVYLAQQIDGYEGILWVGLGIIFVLFIVMIVRALIQKLVLTPYQKKAVGTVIIWLGIYTVFLMFMDPSSNEPWLMVQLPILILLSILFVKPLNKRRLWLPYSILFVLFINNYVGGMWLLKKSKYDYNKQKTEWLIQNANDEDLIISYGPISFVRYLRYHTNARVIAIEEDPDEVNSILSCKEKISGSIYITQDILNPPDAILYRSKEIIDDFNMVYKKNNLKVMPVSSGEFMTYKLSEDTN